MTEEEFKVLYIKIVESEKLSPETAEKILKRILKILYDKDDSESDL